MLFAEELLTYHYHRQIIVPGINVVERISARARALGNKVLFARQNEPLSVTY